MTIKEIEEKTGMSRTNIRFYEAEGLIYPSRRENGYREYSDKDANVLRKVKLLRGMEVPLDQVKAAASGEKSLCQVLTDLRSELDRREARQERSRLVLEKILSGGVEFDALEPELLLPLLEADIAVEDAPPRLNLPWRRFWARRFDYFLYSVVLTLLVRDFIHGDYLTVLLRLPAMLFLEPLLLSLFGTTPGKLIFGIRVMDPEGGRMDYQTALERTWSVMWEGVAMYLPLITWYFQYKGLRTVQQDCILPWEEESELSFRDDKKWRYLLFVPLYIMIRLVFKYTTGG